MKKVTNYKYLIILIAMGGGLVPLFWVIMEEFVFYNPDITFLYGIIEILYVLSVVSFPAIIIFFDYDLSLIDTIRKTPIMLLVNAIIYVYVGLYFSKKKKLSKTKRTE